VRVSSAAVEYRLLRGESLGFKHRAGRVALSEANPLVRIALEPKP